MLESRTGDVFLCDNASSAKGTEGQRPFPRGSAGRFSALASFPALFSGVPLFCFCAEHIHPIETSKNRKNSKCNLHDGNQWHHMAVPGITQHDCPMPFAFARQSYGICFLVTVRAMAHRSPAVYA